MPKHEQRAANELDLPAFRIAEPTRAAMVATYGEDAVAQHEAATNTALRGYVRETVRRQMDGDGRIKNPKGIFG